MTFVFRAFALHSDVNSCTSGLQEQKEDFFQEPGFLLNISQDPLSPNNMIPQEKEIIEFVEV